MPLLQGRLSGRALAGQLSSRQRADVSARGAPWGRDVVQTPAVTPRVTTAWQPTDTGQVAFWVRGDFGVAPTYWNDASGKNLPAYQDFGAPYEPVIDDTTINSKPGARFDGTSYYKLPTIPVGDTGGAAYEYTYVCVYQLDATLGASTFAMLSFFLDDEGYSNALILCEAGTGYEPISMKSRYAATDSAQGWGTSALYDNAAHACIATFDGVDSLDPGSYAAWDNNTAQTVATTSVFTNLAAGAIGGDATATFNMTGAVAEVLIFQGALSAGDRASLDAYLVDRYGLGASSTAYTANVSETLTLAEALAIIAGHNAATAEALALAESLGSIAGLVIGPSETVTLAESLDSLAAFASAVSESVTAAESLSASLGAVVGVAEATTLAEALTAAYGATVAAAESVTIAESLGAVAAFASSLAETLAMAESLGLSLGAAAGVSEALSLAETLSATLAAAAGLSETLTLAEVVEVVTAAQAALAETLAIVEALQAQLGAVVGVDDATTLAEELAAGLQYPIALAETVTLAESLAAGLQYLADVAESLSIAESLAARLDASTSLAEVLALVEALVAARLPRATHYRATDTTTRAGALDTTTQASGRDTTRRADALETTSAAGATDTTPRARSTT